MVGYANHKQTPTRNHQIGQKSRFGVFENGFDCESQSKPIGIESVYPHHVKRDGYPPGREYTEKMFIHGFCLSPHLFDQNSASMADGVMVPFPKNIEDPYLDQVHIRTQTWPNKFPNLWLPSSPWIQARNGKKDDRLTGAFRGGKWNPLWNKKRPPKD